MKILLFFSTLLFTGVLMPRGNRNVIAGVGWGEITSSYFFLLPDRSKEHHAVFNMWDACIKLSGQCKRHCGEDQYRIAYCARHTVDCCMKRCKPVEK
ncbi:beta-defensin 112 [Loxodonta africana]|uniref:beta-defensin 112 n=1 Tax=Loxodonta africana TaxID=9785 RepID=UPI0030D0934F